ncbi:6,7-dimethyl-8-ribityllumazine synthase [Alphaproteobacteria bacterium]|nr:6,7-dimethyl-8-ribityllumazine synthase [Alphaproteobacteria bacterium]
MIKSYKRKKILVVFSNYYEKISENLVQSANDCLEGWGAHITHITVPGALEIPQLINLNLSDKLAFYDGVVALGCVIKGETYHFEVVSNETNRALMNVALNYSMPIGNGVITAYNYDQALKRSFDKGKEAVNACFELMRSRDNLRNINVEKD